MPRLQARCNCGQVVLEAEGKPIIVASCHCSDCQEAGWRFHEMAGAPQILDATSGTPLILFRKDRVRCIAGESLLEAHKLKADSPTYRAVATCCNTPMFLDFTKGFWLSIFRDRFGEDAPPVTMRLMTASRPKGVALPDDLPNHARAPARFVLALMATWAGMGFRTPKFPSSPVKSAGS